jgi:hypothetical protein
MPLFLFIPFTIVILYIMLLIAFREKKQGKVIPFKKDEPKKAS